MSKPLDLSTGAYEVDGVHVLPTEYATGPWFPGQQHGAAVMALIARFLERVPSAQPMRFTRITADISRPVPMEPVEVHTRALRDGQRVQSLEAEIRHRGVVVGRALATRIRVEPGLVPAELLPPEYPQDAVPPFCTRPMAYNSEYPSFHNCLEVHSDGYDEMGNATTWFRLVRPVVTGEVPSASVRIASVADFVPSAASRLGSGWVSINPEVTLQVERLPVGEWLCVENIVRFTDDGIGVSSGVLFDRERRVGASSKSVLNYRRS